MFVCVCVYLREPVHKIFSMAVGSFFGAFFFFFFSFGVDWRAGGELCSPFWTVADNSDLVRKVVGRGLDVTRHTKRERERAGGRERIKRR